MDFYKFTSIYKSNNPATEKKTKAKIRVKIQVVIRVKVKMLPLLIITSLANSFLLVNKKLWQKL